MQPHAGKGQLLRRAYRQTGRSYPNRDLIILAHARSDVAALAAGATLALGLAAGAEAHAKLIKSNPPVGGFAKDTKTLELTFNEALSGKLSGADVIDAAGKTAPSTAMADQGNKGLMVMLKAPLKPGVYKVAWHAVASDDGHRTTGAFAFKVK